MPVNASANDDLYMDILHEIISISLMYESYNFILGGDFNCDMGGGATRDTLLIDFKSLLNLYCPTVDSHHNIHYTFINSQNQKSFIDHFFVNSEFSNKIRNINSLDDGDNLSDHNPIILEIEIDNSHFKPKYNDNKSNGSHFRVCWEEASVEQISCYKQTFIDLIDDLNLPNMSNYYRI